jgi:hypothetical protein
MYQDPANIFQSELSSGEKLIWSGQPLMGMRFRKQDTFLIPFSLLWGGFAIFWEWGVINSKAPFFFRLWGIPFVLVGLYLIFGRFFVDAKQREKTFYGLTSERIIIISGFFSRNVRSLNLKTLSEINLDEKPDGSGTIAFGPVYLSTARWASGGWPGASRYAPPSFELIKRVKEVYESIRCAQNESSKSTLI